MFIVVVVVVVVVVCHPELEGAVVVVGSFVATLSRNVICDLPIRPLSGTLFMRICHCIRRACSARRKDPESPLAMAAHVSHKNDAQILVPRPQDRFEGRSISFETILVSQRDVT